MTTLYFEDNNTLAEVGTVTNYPQAIKLITTFLGSRKNPARYARIWAEEDSQIGWCIVIDYGSWSSFFRIGGFKSAVDAEAFIAAGFNNAEN